MSESALTIKLFVVVLLAVALGLGGARRSRAVLLCWLLVPAGGFFLVTLLRPMYTTRYLIFTLPAYLLLLAVGLVAVGQRSRLLVVGLLLGLLALNGWGLWLQARNPLKTDFRAATAYLTERLTPGDLVLFQIPYGRYSFEYYRSQQEAQAGGAPPRQAGFRVMLPLVASGGAPAYSWAEGLYTNAGMAPEEAARQMAALTDGYQGVWLVATEVSLWDERGLVQAWLAEHAWCQQVQHFVRVDLYYYRFP